MTLYITTADGVQHAVTNNGNIYLRIDGDTYRSTHITWPYTEGDSPLPDSFQVGDTQAADANRFYVDDWSISFTSACVLPRTFLMMAFPVSGSWPTVYRPSQRPSFRFRILPSPFARRFGIKSAPFDNEHFHSVRSTF